MGFEKGKEDQESKRKSQRRKKGDNQLYCFQLYCSSRLPGGLAETHIVGPGPRLAELRGDGLGLLTCISNKFPSDADVTERRGMKGTH